MGKRRKARWNLSPLQVPGAGDAFEPRNQVEVGVKAGDHEDCALPTGEGHQRIVEVKLTIGGVHQFQHLRVEAWYIGKNSGDSFSWNQGVEAL
jgi:hypothetical protein